MARVLDRNAALVCIDDRFAYDVVRMIALGLESATLQDVCFVDRGSLRMIISLRRATRPEVKRYVDEIEND